MAGTQQQRQFAPESGRSDTEDAIAELELAVQQNPRQAEHWCRLGELWHAMACNAPDNERAVQYRDKAVVALTQAIGLRPGIAKAHYVLANVYRAQDMRLALLELEAAAKCDPDTYQGALNEALAQVRACTYRLCDLDVTIADAAEEEPRRDILESEFYFEGAPIRAAIIHTCIAKGQGQLAKAWLFESATHGRDARHAIAEIAISPNGSVFVATTRPDAPELQEAPSVGEAAAVSRASRRRSAVWMPLAMLVVVFAGTLFAYRVLVAPASSQERAAGAPADSRARVAADTTGEADSPINALSMRRFTSPQADTPPVQAETAALEAEAPTQSTPAAPVQHSTTAAPVRNKAPVHTPAKHEQRLARVAASTTRIDKPTVEPAQRGSTHVAAVETKLPRQVTLATPPSGVEAVSTTAPRADEPAAPPKQKELSTLPPPRKDTPTPPPLARSEEPVAIPAVRKEEPPAVSPWLRRLRSELAACGQAGVLLNDLCREAARWKYCYAGRWDTVGECAVPRFASSGVN